MNDIAAEIKVWQAKRQAVILAHNYVAGEVQDIADFVGDSLELSIKAAGTRAPVIVFCGVSFMAETAKLLAPESIVLLPEPAAGCPMADMADAARIAEYRRQHPDTVLVAYVNTTAAVKAEVDICCTSANAERVVASIPADRKILFLPDQNLGANVAAKLGRTFALFPGFCPTHNRIHPEMIQAARAAHPGCPVLVHPECLPAVVAEADVALSTGGMLRYVRESAAGGFVIGTESGIIHRMKKENPGKMFYPILPEPRCPNMKKISLEKVLHSLQTLETRVELPPELMERARRPIERMLALQ